MGPSKSAPRGRRVLIPSRRAGDPWCESGVALIAVLWLIVLLTLLASAAATVSVTHRRVVERYGEAVRLQALEDSAIRVTVLRLLAVQEPERARLLSRLQIVSVLKSAVAVTVTREAGRVDLNTSDPQMLFALFSANGLGAADARLMSEQIVSWRGSDRNGSASSLAQTPFESMSELRQALGSEVLSPELADALTVYSHLTFPVAAAAPPAVRRALSWADQQQLGGHGWLNRELATEPPPGSADLSSPLAGEVLRVRACLRDQSAASCRLAIVRPIANAREPFEVFAWQIDRDF
jgi:hypothetical protein